MISHPRRIGLVIAATVAALWLVFIVPDSPPTDLQVYLLGGQWLAHGEPVYQQSALIGGLNLLFIYPAFAAVLFIPLAALPLTAATILWALISALCVGVIAYFTAVGFRELIGGPRMWPTIDIALGFFVIYAISEPVWDTFRLGQINLLVMALVIADVVRRQGRWSGILIGIATGIKVTPGIFILFAGIRRKWRATGMAIAALLATILIGAIFGVQQSISYWTSTVFNLNIEQPERVDNMSIQGILLRLPIDHRSMVGMWLVASVVLVVFCLWLAYKWWPRSRLIAATILSLATLLASPVSWVNHWVWMPAALITLAGLCHLALQRKNYRLTSGLFVIIIVIAILLITHVRWYWVDAFHLSNLQLSTYVGNSYSLMAIASLVCYALSLKLVDTQSAGNGDD